MAGTGQQLEDGAGRCRLPGRFRMPTGDSTTLGVCSHPPRGGRRIRNTVSRPRPAGQHFVRTVPQARLVIRGRLYNQACSDRRRGLAFARDGTGPTAVRYVVAVARERNFTRAAEQLHVAQQALSQQVRGGEDARRSALRPGSAPGEADPGREPCSSRKPSARCRLLSGCSNGHARRPAGNWGRSAWPTPSPSPTRPCPPFSAHSLKTRPRYFSTCIVQISPVMNRR